MKTKFDLDKSISALTEEYIFLKNEIGNESMLELCIPGYQSSLSRLKKSIRQLTTIKKIRECSE